MSAEPRHENFAMHYQEPYLEDAGAPEFPLWLRVACLAYGSHRQNGHAVFRPGQVSRVLSKVDLETGEITEPSRQQVHRAIQTAIGHKWLREGSTSLCLVVPSHRISGGSKGYPAEPCPQHTRPDARRQSERQHLKVAQ